MLTVQQLIDDLLNETLLGTYRAHFNVLSLALDNSALRLTTKHPLTGIGDGSYIEIDQELLYVVPSGVNITAKTLDVVRGVRGTTPATHAAGAGIAINPRFARSVILAAFQEEVRSWPISLFRTVAVDLETMSEVTAIDLVAESGFTDIVRVIQVYRQGNAPDPNRWIPLNGWRFERDLFLNGSANVYLGNFYSTGQALKVLVARPFGDPAGWTEATQIYTASGIPDSCGDILKFGAAWRLISGRETRRLFTEIESEGRNPQEVPAGANMTLGRQLKLMRDGRLAEEITRLRSLHGIRMR